MNEDFMKALESLHAERFDMTDQQRIELLSQKLQGSKRGWINPNINNLVKTQNIPSCSDEILCCYYPSIYQYLQQIPRQYWFVITIPQGVNAGDTFLYQNFENHFESFMSIKEEIWQWGIGELLFFKIEQSHIIVVFNVEQPIDNNANNLSIILQQWINNQYYRIYRQMNYSWRVRYSQVYEYNDIPVTLRNVEKGIIV